MNRIFKNTIKLVLLFIVSSVLLVGLAMPFIPAMAVEPDSASCRNCHEQQAIELWVGTAHQDSECSTCHGVIFLNESTHTVTEYLCTSCHAISLEHEHSALADNSCLPCHSRGVYQYNISKKSGMYITVDMTTNSVDFVN